MRRAVLLVSLPSFLDAPRWEDGGAPSTSLTATTVHACVRACVCVAGPEDLRCSPCYFNLGKVFLAQGERVNALACNAKVLAIWLCTLCNVVLGELPSTCKIENPASEISLNKAQLREARARRD